MSDIVERLHHEARFGVHLAANRQMDTRDLHAEAADQIRSLRAELKGERELVRYLQYYRDHVMDHDRALDAAAAKHADKLEAKDRAYAKKRQEGE